MKTYTTVEDAVKIAAARLVTEQISFDVSKLRALVYSWYSHSDVTDPFILAACALSGRPWFSKATYQDMLALEREWFWGLEFVPEYLNISEIEASQHDAFWR